MLLVDAHCHLESDELRGQLDALLADARAAGVVRLVTAAVSPEQWPVPASIAGAHPEVAYALGIHPWFATPAHVDEMEALLDAARPGAAAIGEIGLDKKIDTPGMDVQRRVFEAQLNVAAEAELPVVIHCRGAFNELIECFKRVGAPPRGGIVHAFSGSVEVAEACLGYGLDFSMGGALSYRNSKKRARVLKRIYPDHLLLETDSPDMPPVQVNHKPNVPANIRFNLRGAAETLGLEAEAIAEQTARNAARVFALDLE